MRLLVSAITAVAAAMLVGFVTGVLPGKGTRRTSTPQVDVHQLWLIQAGLDLTPRQFRLASLGVGVVAFGLFGVITGVLAVAVAPAVLAGIAPRLYFGRQRDRRLHEVQAAWPDGIRDLIASIAAGMSLQRAIENLTTSGPEPLRRAFDRFPYLARTLGLVPALEVIKEELADPTSDRVIEVLVLAHQRGGSVVPQILRDLAEATSRDIWTLEEIQTASLEQKINARAVFALPWLVLVAITARQGEFRDFYASPGGLVVVLVGGMMSGVGMTLVSKLGREPDEPRVFGAAGTGVA